MKFLYHGSSRKIECEYLTPSPTRVLEGEDAVFASKSFDLALLFSGERWTDNDMELMVHNNILYMIEKKCGIFSSTFSGVQGFIYKLSPSGFKNDSRLGLQGIEVIKRSPSRILGHIEIPDVGWKILNDSKIIVVFYEELFKIYPVKRKFDLFLREDINRSHLEVISQGDKKSIRVKSEGVSPDIQLFKGLILCFRTRDDYLYTMY